MEFARRKFLIKAVKDMNGETYYSSFSTFKPSLMGDINGDRKITAGDARLALRIAILLDDSTKESKKLADIDKNGTVTVEDARLILRAAVGLEKLN